MFLKKVLIIAGVILFFQGCVEVDSIKHGSNVQQTDRDIWLSISFQKGPVNDSVTAKILKPFYNKIMSGKITTGWLELKNVQWASKGKFERQSIAAKGWGYSDTMTIRIESINWVIPLTDDAIANIESGGDSFYRY